MIVKGKMKLSYQNVKGSFNRGGKSDPELIHQKKNWVFSLKSKVPLLFWIKWPEICPIFFTSSNFTWSKDTLYNSY